MKRSTRRLLGLLVVVLVLVAASAWQWRADQQRAPGTLLSLAPQAVTRIRLQRPGQPEYRFELHGTQWWRSAPGPRTPVDAKAMQALAALAATPVLRWRSATELDPGRIGLEAPAVILQLNGHALAYGELAAFGPRRYVRVGARVAVISARYSPRLRGVTEASAAAPAASSAASPASSMPSSQKS